MKLAEIAFWGVTEIIDQGHFLFPPLRNGQI
jgi:hypothetical protein